MSELLTIGTIAKRAGVPVHKVRYVLTTRHDITATSRAGQARVYSEAAAVKILAALKAIGASHAALADSK
jgi:DNA-binding transcriptional MerR regulator